jgi:hypothetical protein
MRQGISCECRAGSNAKLEQFRVSRIDHQSGQVILPQVQIALGEVAGIAHRAQYMPEDR